MSVAENTPITDSEIENEIEDIISRLERIDNVIVNLKKKGRASYSQVLLKEKLARITKIWDDALERYSVLKKAIPMAKRKCYAFFREGQMAQAEEQFLEAENYLTSELARLVEEQERIALGINQRNSEENSSAATHIPLELPKQSLPKFGGDPRSWSHFEDLFTAGIIKNKRLSDAQRLQYLNACLEGQALASIASLEIADRNFEVAWEILRNQFGKPRIVIAQLLENFRKLKPIKKGDLASLQQVTVGWKQTLAALEKLKRPVEHWSDLLVLLVKDKLEPDLDWEWEMSLKNAKEYPTFKEMLEFLELRACALLVPNEQRRKSAPEPHAKHRLRSHNTVVDARPAAAKVCVFCCQAHEVTNCGSFKRLSPEQRSQFMRRSQYCIVCMASSHKAGQCQSPKVCEKCSGKHHTLLHFEKQATGAVKRKPVRNTASEKWEPKASDASQCSDKPSASPPSASVTSHCSALENQRFETRTASYD